MEAKKNDNPLCMYDTEYITYSRGSETCWFQKLPSIYNSHKQPSRVDEKMF